MNRQGKNYFLIGFVCAIFIASGFYAGNVFAFEHPRYEITAAVDSAEKTIAAKEKVTFVNNADNPTQELYFHIYPNRKYTDEEMAFMARYAGYFKVNPFPEGFKQGKLEIQNVSLGGKNLDFRIEGADQTLLKVMLDAPLQKGESISVDIDFMAVIPHAYGRFGWHEDIMALARWYPILSVHDKEGWNTHPFYPFHRPFFSESANYSVQLTVPDNQVIIHSGDLISETQNSSGTKTVVLETENPVRDFSLALSPSYKIFETTEQGVAIKSFYKEGDEGRAKEALNDAKDTFNHYIKRFGVYPYKEFSIAPVYLGYGGEQMSNMIFIDTRVYGLPKFLSRYFDFLISHEAGHQWFYNLLGVDGFSNMWLEEGVNSYFNLEYLENKYGKDAAVVVLPKYLDWLLPNFSFRRGRDYRYKTIARTNLDRPVTGKLSSFTEPSSIFSITYGKGSRIISMLRYKIGDEAFKKVFKRIFQEYQFRNLTVDDFMRVCQEESGQDLREEFFDPWLSTTKKYDVAVNGVRGGKILLENRGEITMPVDLRVEFSDGTVKDMAWDGRGKTKEMAVDGAASVKVKRVSLDPNENILDIDRTNNIWPRQIYVKPVPLYVGLYDIALFQKEDAYNLIAGPELANSGIGIKAALHKPFDQSFYAASDYNFNEGLVQSRLGYQLNNVANKAQTVGFEVFNTQDKDGGEEDLAGAKAYFRRELWPASYGLGDINDHVTGYLIRNRSLARGFSIGGNEDSRNTSYLRKDEAIIGGVLHLGKAGTYPDPAQGYKLDALLENSGHFLGATQYFYRGSLDWAGYKPVTAKTKLALRLKYGWGFPYDKNLYELGGMEGLRGYDRKTLRGARMGLGSLEYRFPLKENINWKFLDNIFGVESVGGVVFVEAGKSWFENFEDTQLKKDAGIGLRVTVNVGSFLEKAILRLDMAQAINESKEDTHFWFGINQAF